MTEQEMGEIAEQAFKGPFPDVELNRVNVWPGPALEDESPVVDISIIYEGKYGQLNGRGLRKTVSEIAGKNPLQGGGGARLPQRPLLFQA